MEVVARKNSRDLNTLADEFEKAARKAEGAGKSFDKTASFSKHLDDQIAKTKASVKELGAEFDRTGNKDVFAKLRGTQANLKSLENIRRQLSTAIDRGAEDGAKSLLHRFVAEGKQIGANFGEMFEGGFAGLLRSPMGIGLVASAGAVAGNALFGALLTGVGLGGIATGIIGALKDPRVKAAGSELGTDVSAGFKDATASFSTPLITGLYVFDKEWKRLQPGLKSTFAELAPLTVDLAKGAAGFADNFVPAVERAAVASKPLVQDLAQWLPKFGREAGGVFDALARNKDALLTGLHEVEGTIDGVTKAAGFLVPVVAKVTQVFALGHAVLGPIGPVIHEIGTAWDFVQGKTPGMQTLARSLVDTSGATDELSRTFGSAKLNADQMAEAVQKLEQRLESQFQTTMDLSQATGNWTHDLANLKSALDIHDRTLNETTDAGHKNADALRQMAAEAERVREATIAAAGGQNASAAAVDAANRKYLDQIGQLEAMGVRLGLSKSAVHQLVDQFLNLIKLPNVTKYVTTVYQSDYQDYRAGERATHQYGGIQHFALGGTFAAGSAGVVSGGGPYAMFGEPGTGANTEGFVPRRGISRMRAGGLLSEMASWYGYGVADMSGGGKAAPSRPSTMEFAGNVDGVFATAFKNLLRTGAIVLYDSAGQRVTVT